MAHITKDEMYNWMPTEERFSDADIPNDMFAQLEDAIMHYRNVCLRISEYLIQHPEKRLNVEDN